MQTARTFSFLLLVALVGCGGATESLLLEADGSSSGMDSGRPDVGIPDARHKRDVENAPDAAPDTEMMETGPMDTGPVDTGPTFPPLYCGTASSTPCTIPDHECCVNTNNDPDTFMCESVLRKMSCEDEGNVPVQCDQLADCPAPQLCCGTKTSSYGGYDYVQCETTCSSDDDTKVLFCQDGATPDVCAPSGKTCQPSGLLIGYYVCN